MSEEVPFYVKFLVTHKVAGLIIGKSGSRITQIQNDTNAQVKVNSVTQHGVPTDRVVVIAGTTDNLLRAVEYVLHDILENPPAPTTSSGNTPNNTSSNHSQQDASTVKLLVPPAAAPGIIGTGGKNIRDIQEQTGAVIRITSRQLLPNGKRANVQDEEERLVTINGSLPQIMQAVTGLLPFIKEFSKAPNEEAIRDTLSRSSRLPRVIALANEFPQSLFRMTTTLEMVVDDADVGAIIGKQGQRITELTNRLGVWMRVSGRSDDHNNPVTQRRVTLTGPVSNLHRAHLEILYAIETAAQARREQQQGGSGQTGRSQSGQNGSGNGVMVVNSIPMMRGVAPNMIGSYPASQQTIYLPQN